MIGLFTAWNVLYKLVLVVALALSIAVAASLMSNPDVWAVLNESSRSQATASLAFSAIGLIFMVLGVIIVLGIFFHTMFKAKKALTDLPGLKSMIHSLTEHDE